MKPTHSVILPDRRVVSMDSPEYDEHIRAEIASWLPEDHRGSYPGSACAIPGCVCGEPRPEPAVERKGLGRARPQPQALREFQERAAQLYRDVRQDRLCLVPLILVTDASKIYRWLVRLTCGCLTEAHTPGDEVSPVDIAVRDMGFMLPPGQRVCRDHDAGVVASHPYRTVVDYHMRSEWTSQPDPAYRPDPSEPPLPSRLVRRIYPTEPQTFARWTVTLCCGHQNISLVDDLLWKPAHGARRKYRAHDAPRHLARLSEIPPGDMWPPSQREHLFRMAEQGWPTPTPEHSCWSCLRARAIIAYQRIGWLVPRPKPPTVAQVKSSQSILKHRLKALEAEAQRLRDEIQRQAGTR
jgi:hypothetical protein